MIRLGAKVRCTVTGFEGTVTQRREILHGSTTVLVEGHENGYRRDEWLEERRVREIDTPLASVSEIAQLAEPAAEIAFAGASLPDCGI